MKKTIKQSKSIVEKVEDFKCCDELYGGSCNALENAMKSNEEVKNKNAKALEPALKDVEDLKKMTVDRRETKAPKFESIKVKDRVELRKLVGEAVKSNLKYNVSKSIEEGFEYVLNREVVTLNEEKECKDCEDGIIHIKSKKMREIDIPEKEDEDDIGHPIRHGLGAIGKLGSKRPKFELDEDDNEDYSSVLNDLKNDKFLSKYLYGNVWVSGSSTDVYPVMEWKNDIEVQLNTDKNVFNNFIDRFVNNHSNLLSSGRFIKGDGSVPSYLKFIKKHSNNKLKESDNEDEIKIEEPIEDVEVVTNTTENTSPFYIQGLVDLIKDEWEAYQGYVSYKENISVCEECKDLSNLIEDIANEELVHVGELQEALRKLTSSVSKIEDGQVEAQDKLSADVEEALSFNGKDMPEINKLAKEIGIYTFKDLERFAKEEGVEDKSLLDVLKAYRQELGPDFKIKDESCDKKLDEAKIIIDDISEFQPWSGAVDTWNKIVDANKIDELDFLLDDLYPDGINRTALNDILWFDSDWVLNMLGLEDINDDEE